MPKTAPRKRNQRDKRYQIRHSAADMKRWQANAAKLGIDVSDYLRVCEAKAAGVQIEVTPIAQTVTMGGPS